MEILPTGKGTTEGLCVCYFEQFAPVHSDHNENGTDRDNYRMVRNSETNLRLVRQGPELQKVVLNRKFVFK